jgi:hypothetical protein
MKDTGLTFISTSLVTPCSRDSNTYVNHWETPTAMVNIDDTAMRGGGYALKQMIWNAARETIRLVSEKFDVHAVFLSF